MKKTKKEIVIPILNDEYKVIFCWGTDKDIKKVLKSWHYSKETTDVDFLDRRGACFYQKDCHPVIAMPRRPKTPTEIATLAHEAVHAIEDIFAKIQQPIGGELFAHSIGAVVRKVLHK